MIVKNDIFVFVGLLRGNSRCDSATIHNSIVAYAKSDIATWKNAWIFNNVLTSSILLDYRYYSYCRRIHSSSSYSAGAPVGVAQFGSIGFGEDPI